MGFRILRVYRGFAGWKQTKVSTGDIDEGFLSGLL